MLSIHCFKNLLFSTINDFKAKYEFLLTEIRSLANDSELGFDETTKCYDTIQNKYVHLANSFTDLVRLVSMVDFERYSFEITVNIQQLLGALRIYTVNN